MSIPLRISILVEERGGLGRASAVFGIGVPLPRGVVRTHAALTLSDEDGRALPTQTRALAFWPDGSAKWVFVEGLITMGPYAQRRVLLTEGPQRSGDFPSEPTQVRLENGSRYSVDTGTAKFEIGGAGSLIESVEVGGVSMLDASGVQLSLTGCAGQAYLPVTNEVHIEEDGPVRTTVVAAGHFAKAGVRREPAVPIRFKARLEFTAGSASVRIDVQLHNPRAARHPRGLWDLDDQGTILFADVSLALKPEGVVEELRWYAENPGDAHIEVPEDWTLYQDSSGGENWDSDNHVDGKGKSTVTFRGYRVTYGHARKACLIAEGDRATPALSVVTERGTLCATVLDFWQNFPKALRWSDATLEVALFPWESRSHFALQGGERKRHTVVIQFSLPGASPAIETEQQPLRVTLDPSWVELSKAIESFIPAQCDGNSDYLHYIQSIIDGPCSFERKRETIDEYGWRNFGDLYADHEAVNGTSPRPLISHYNNQYDFIHGALIHYLRTTDSRWWALAHDAARHSIDIDIYHTDADRPAFNRGLFWHTDHYKSAGTCTHRTYSRLNGTGLSYGGGPSNEHNYTSGLLLYYFLTGDPEAAEAVRELAGWVLAMDDAPSSLRHENGGPSGLASQTADSTYHKAGRGAGNSINALLDVYQLGDGRSYLEKAEELILRCIHPKDDIDELGLSQPEHRWSYLVFLQVLGKYLHIKWGQNETDYTFHYARESFLHYARWMMRNEVPYKDILDKVHLPTETWPAQDVRKCHVLHLAGQFSAEPERASFHEKADFFFERAVQDVLSFDTAYLTRPRVILCGYGHLQAYYQAHRAVGIDLGCPVQSFGEPQQFVPGGRNWRARALNLGLRLIRVGVERLDVLHHLSTPIRL